MAASAKARSSRELSLKQTSDMVSWGWSFFGWRYVRFQGKSRAQGLVGFGAPGLVGFGEFSNPEVGSDLHLTPYTIDSKKIFQQKHEQKI